MSGKIKSSAIKAINKVSIEKERVEFKNFLLKNPNYFGTMPKYPLQPVIPINSNTKYEEVKCIGFYPESDMLEAVINIKLPFGYKGSLCSFGSFEYVRFFIDWNGDGSYSDPDSDVGIASVNIHDIPDGEKACLDNTKPLSYAVTLTIKPKKYLCNRPNLVKVKAILSWENPPPAGNPNFIPVWGNIIEKWIQIKPAPFYLKDLSKVANLEKYNLDPSMLELDSPVMKFKTLSVEELKIEYKDKDVPEHRFNLSEMAHFVKEVESNPALMAKYKIEPQYEKMIANIGPMLEGKPNTAYEGLTCLGLNYDMDMLVAILKVSKPYGYNGNLCTAGSSEYVAFWAYVWDQIEQLCYWKYFGTSKVNVHDIPNIPSDGLQYAVFLPVDLMAYKDMCSKPKILKVRAILSWQTPPPTNNPNYNPVWGNKIDTVIQLKPSKPIETGKQVPFISVVGGMAVESISGNPHTVIPSALGDGYANGPSVYGGFTALESPFGASIAICGHISNPPNDPPTDAQKLKYKVQFRKVGKTWQDLNNTFTIWISTWNGINWIMMHKDQAAPTGYYSYEEDLTPPIQRFVEGNVLAQWFTPVSDGDGLYEVRVLLYQPGAPASPGVPADHVPSNIVRVMVDNTPPIASITLDAKPCAKLKVGTDITGKFTALDDNINNYILSLSPSVPKPPVFTPPSSESYPAMPTPGRTNQVFTLKTVTDTTSCGYVIYLQVWDRAIRNNYLYGNYAAASVGFCLLD